MDIFGAVVNAIQVTQILLKYGKDVAEAREEMAKFRGQIHLIDQSMQQIEAAVQKVSDAEKTEIDFAKWKELLYFNAQHRYNPICADLRKRFTRGEKWTDYLKWPLKRKGLQDKMRDLMWSHDMLRGFLQVIKAKSTRRVELSLSRFEIAMDLEKNHTPISVCRRMAFFCK
jgi:hypothetical protein